MAMLRMRKIEIQAALERKPSWTDSRASALQPRLMMSRIAWQAHVHGKYLSNTIVRELEIHLTIHLKNERIHLNIFSPILKAQVNLGFLVLYGMVK